MLLDEEKFLYERRDGKGLTGWQTTKRTIDALSIISTPVVMMMEMMKVRWMTILTMTVAILFGNQARWAYSL